MKYEWRKEAKALYQVKARPTILQIPGQSYIVIDGKGDPNQEDFSERVGALYALAYAIKMKYKKAPRDQVYTDFTVFPLEGLWKKEKEGELVKSELFYSIMIGQPDFITRELFEEALNEAKIKKPNPLYEAIRFEKIEEGQRLAMLHVGSFDSENETFAEMECFCQLHKLKRTTEVHREIYLNNLHRTDSSKLKTILRYQVQEEN
ncbi:GyrI-like domain-containing protein [Streptococcus infantis]|uniref:GyrI-like domain-containing protein n=1 Tax=Streptococcus infantis TaxID=68892 RepID=UPI0039C00E04